MSVQIVSLLQPGIQSAIDSAAKHLTAETRDELLGPTLAQFAKGGTGKTLLALACYADGLRVVFNALLADGEISAEEVEQAESFLAIVAAHFAKLRPEYAAFATLTRANLGSFLKQYRADSGPFGFKDDSTKWAGVAVCQHISDQCTDSKALDVLRASLVRAAELLLSADGMEEEEEEFLHELKAELGVEDSEEIEDEDEVDDDWDEDEDGEDEDGDDDEDEPEERTLTKEIAAQFLADEHSVDLRGFTVIEDEAAEVLSKSGAFLLELTSITKVSDAAISSLSQFKGAIWLDSVTRLTEQAAYCLSRHVVSAANAERLADSGSTPFLVLGIQTLTDTQAAAFAGYQGNLWLEIGSLSDTAAAELSRHKGELSLGHIHALSEAAAANLSRHDGVLWMGSLESLSEGEGFVRLAHHFAAHSSDEVQIDLPCLRDASLEVITALSKGATLIYLNGLTSLSDAAAESLSKHEGGLSLNGLTSLSDAAAESLSKSEGGLWLNGLTSLSDAAAESLSRHKGQVSLGSLICDPFGVVELPDEIFLSENYGDDELPPALIGVISDPEGTIVNSIGMKLVPIPAGEFLMGSPLDDPQGDQSEEFQHRVRITRSFYMGMYAVTQGEYIQVVNSNPSYFDVDCERHPVEHLSWVDAAEFCKRLSELPEEQRAGRKYRLPTEAEWEYACRAGTTTRFNTGDELSPDMARFSAISRLSPKRTARVGTYPPNAWGLYEMHGNVWEWTADWFSADYYRKSPIDDPKGPAKGTHHTLRGGSASVQAHECRTAIRGEVARDCPDANDDSNRYKFYGDFGVRVVCILSAG